MPTNDDAKQKDIQTVLAALKADTEALAAFERLLGDWSSETHDWQFAAGMNCAGTPDRLRQTIERNADLVRQFR